MAASEMKELLTHELGDLLYAEQLILKMLGTLTREVKNPEMLGRVREHVGETEEQIERLRRAFESVGEKARAEKCDAAIGLKEEHDSFKKEEKPSKALLEAFDLGNSLRVEHYEIAGYRSAIAVATALGERECVALLSESLREEEAMAAFIERSSVKALKGLAVGMDLASGASEVVLTTGGSRGRSGARSAASASRSTSAARRGNGKSNGRGTTSDGSGSRSASSKSGGTSSAGSTRSRSSSSKSGGGGSRTTAERASAGKSSGASRSTSGKSGGSASRTGGGKSGSASSSRSRSTRSGSGSSART